MSLSDRISDRDANARLAAATHLVDDQVQIVYKYKQLIEVEYVKQDASTDKLYAKAEALFDISEAVLLVKTSTGDYYVLSYHTIPFCCIITGTRYTRGTSFGS